MGGGKRIDDSLSWAEALADSQLIRGKFPPDDEDWKTFEELKSETELGKERLRDFLVELKKKKKLKTFTGSAPSKTIGVCCRQVWYRLV
jgi:uncharacterized protein YeaO (DUF488 family)